MTPVVYPVRDKDFGPFWQDMGLWADLVELPRAWRRSRLESLAARPFDQLAPWELDQAAWILSQPGAYELLPTTQLSPEWITFIRSRGLPRADARMEYSIGRWAAQRLGDTRAFGEILAFAETLGAEAAEALERGLSIKDRERLPARLEKAWRILTIYLRDKAPPDELRKILAEDRLKAGDATAADWNTLIEPFRPRLHLRLPYKAETPEGSISELVRIELEPERHIDPSDLLHRVPEDSPHCWPLLMAANSAMFAALWLAAEAGLTGTDFDAVSLSVPSIGEHTQNAIPTGFLPLTTVSAQMWLRLHKFDTQKTRAISQTWRVADFRLLKRLWLFALANDESLNADEIVDALLDLPASDFWEIRKELMELVRDRVGAASEASIRKLVDRIVVGPLLKDGLEPDLRDDFSSSAIWLHLKVLELSGARLPTDAQETLSDIRDRKRWANRELEEADYFWMWSGGIRHGPIGDPAPIEEAPTEKQVEVAANLERTDAFNQTDVWRVYSKSNPGGALDAVIAAGTVGEHLSRWEDVIRAISQIGTADDRAKNLGKDLTRRAFDILENELDSVAEALCRQLVDLYAYSLEVGAAIPEAWWDRLWRCAASVGSGVSSTSGDDDPGYGLISRAVNSPSGVLIRLPINKLGPPWKGLSAAEQRRVRGQLRTGIDCDQIGGSYSRAIITQFVPWIHDSTPGLLDGNFHKALTADTDEGRALRSILVGMSAQVGSRLRARLRRPLLKGIVEHTGTSVSAENAASRLVAYVRDDLGRPEGDRRRLRAGGAKALLRQASSAVRTGCAEVMADWLESDTTGPSHELWHDEFAKIFDSIWPADRRYQTGQASHSLAKLALMAGEAFPAALDTLAPYLVALDQDWPHFYFMTRPSAKVTIERFPKEALLLLWLLLRPAERGQASDLGKILVHIATAAPDLKKDRRFQRLETRAMRLG